VKLLRFLQARRHGGLWKAAGVPLKISKFSKEVPRPHPCREGDTPSPHLTPLDAFGLLTLPPSAARCPSSVCWCSSSWLGLAMRLIFERPFVKRFALCCGSVVLSVLFCLSVTFEHCGQTIGRIKMKLNWHSGRPQPWPHCVRWRRSPSHPQKGGRAPSPIFGLFLLWPNGLMHQDATWYGGRPQPRRLCVRWGPSFPSPKRGRRPSPQFSAHVHCGQRAGCIKLPLGMEVGLSRATL